MTLKDHLSFSILVVFTFSLFCLLFALSLSWGGKENSSYFLIASFMLAVLGSILCTNKNISVSEVVNAIAEARKK